MTTPSSAVRVELLSCHSNHLFNSPCCEHLSTLKKVAHLFFHVFTLGIPLVIYYFATHYFGRATTKNPIDKPFSDKIISTVASQSLSASAVDEGLKKETIAFAMQMLEKHPKIEAFEFRCGWGEPVHQPTTPIIGKLTSLYLQQFERFEIALKKTYSDLNTSRNNPWDSKETREIADTCMKLGYAISVLTLEDLQPFTDKLLKDAGDKRTFAKALTHQDSYQYRTFYYCTRMYHICRGGLIWDKPYKYAEADLNYPRTLSQEHVQPFYEKGTIQNSWNKLYNDYCDRIASFVDREELRQADNRHFTWTKKDVGVTTFCNTPDTLPT